MIHKKIGEIAVERNWLTAEECEFILQRQKQKREQGAEDSLFGQLMIEQGVCSENMVRELLGQQNTSVEFLFYSLKSGGAPFVFGVYSIEALIGEGGMGEVYRAKNRNGEYIAIKTIHSKNYCEKSTKRFLREINTIIELNHAHIVPVLDSGCIHGIDFLAMQYLNGATLGEAIAQKKFSLRQWLEKFLPLLDAIETIHQKKIIHRDLKPSNIIVTEEQKLILIDFGLSKDISNDYTSLFTTHPIGTPAYMSPEQIFSEQELDCRSDIWSLGIILYQVITGKLPFYSKNIQRLMHHIQNKEPKNIREYNANLPEALDYICRKALRKKLHLRYQNVAEMARDIFRYLQGTWNYDKINLPESISVGNYTTINLLGEGSMGKVYRACDQNNNVVAIKIFHNYLAQNQYFRRRFSSGANWAKEFRHNHAMSVLDFAEEKNQIYLIMDYSAAFSLKTILDEEKTMEEKEALQIIRQLLAVLQAGHSESFFHLNLKPSNILLETRKNQDHLLLLDMGIAKLANPDLFHYTAPEQIIGEKADAQADLYSTGILLYQMITGQLPFNGENQAEIFSCIISQEHSPPTTINKALHEQTDKIIARALAKDRKKRFGHAHEFMAAIDSTLNNW